MFSCAFVVPQVAERRDAVQNQWLLCGTWLVLNPDQVRLHPTLTSSLFIYTLPVQPILTPTSAAMALSGYDFAPNTFLSFSVQLSYDADANSYQIVFKTENGTQVYLINYFLIEVGQSASNWIVAQSFCNLNLI